MSEDYDEFNMEDIEDIGDDIYGTYNEEDINISDDESRLDEKEDDIYSKMFNEFNLTQQLGEKDIGLQSEDILLRINEQDDEKKDDRDIDDLIDRGLETRFFQSDPNSFLNSRVGIAERIGQEQELGTIIKGFDKLAKKQEKINRMMMSSQQIFMINFDKACSKFDINKSKVDGLLTLIFKTEFYEYKNPTGCLLGYLCIKNKKIDTKQLNDVFEKYASSENMSILDLTRYARFIKSLI
jgi:hypothetical protein